MKEYYIKRNGLLNDELQVDLDKILEYFSSIYTYFANKNYFEAAIYGVWSKDYCGNDQDQIHAPSFIPSIDIFFANIFKSIEVWPIKEFIEDFSEEQLFTMIEILYDHINIYNYDDNEFKRTECQEEYLIHVNNVLKLYDGGYYLEPQNGFVMKQPNRALKEQLSYNGNEIEDEVYHQLQVATKMYYRFSATLEERKKAINILADILEGFTVDLKEIFNDEFSTNKKEHDGLVFFTVNKFNIRHNNESQVKEYSKDIWYDWMMQYYTATIITYHKLKCKNSAEPFKI